MTNFEDQSVGWHLRWVAPLFLIVGTIGSMFVGCANRETPEGHEGYVYEEPIVFGQKHFVTTQTGPTSTGFQWRNYVVNVDMRPQTYSAVYKILTADNLNISFESNARISLRPGSVQDVVERFGSTEWYKKNVEKQYMAEVRRRVREHNAYDVKGNAVAIADAVLTALRLQYKTSPIVFETMDIGNIDYPASVNRQIEAKLAAQQELERQEIQKLIAEREAEIEVIEARGIAGAQEIINKTLTREYLQWKAIEAYKELAQSNNSTFIIVPTSTNGTGMPLIINTRPRSTTPAKDDDE